jgi:hypothetical protein
MDAVTAIGDKVHALLLKRSFAVKVLGTGCVLLLFINYVGPFRLCGTVGGDFCPAAAAEAELLLLPFVPLFVFSLITYFMREEFYEESVKSAIVWFLGTAALVLLMPGSTKTTALLVMMAIFVGVVCWSVIVEFFGAPEQSI